jgi:ubiquinone/menaquinone biosynthesis C-methylase UbiE
MNIKKIRIEPTWWTSNGGFFGESYLEADDSFEGFMNTPKVMGQRIQDEVDGVIKLCKLKKKDFVLDAPCGYGRHSIGLVRKGLNVIGVDINKYFLDYARKRAKDLKLKNCKFYKRDLRKIKFHNQFNAVINMFYSFGFFDKEEDDFLVIKNFYESLKNGGKFLMHTFITLPKIRSGNYKKHDIRNLTSGNKLELFRDYNFETKREYGEWYILRNNGRKVILTPYSMRIYTDLEFIGLCIKAGFNKVEVYGDWKGIKYKDDSELMIVVATK